MAIFQARTLKFYVEVDLDNPNQYMTSIFTSASALTSIFEAKKLNSHNLVIFQAMNLKFFMEVDLDNP